MFPYTKAKIIMQSRKKENKSADGGADGAGGGGGGGYRGRSPSVDALPPASSPMQIIMALLKDSPAELFSGIVRAPRVNDVKRKRRERVVKQKKKRRDEKKKARLTHAALWSESVRVLEYLVCDNSEETDGTYGIWSGVCVCVCVCRKFQDTV